MDELRCLLLLLLLILLRDYFGRVLEPFCIFLKEISIFLHLLLPCIPILSQLSLGSHVEILNLVPSLL